LNFAGGSSGATIVGGSGTISISGGSAVTTLFGGSGGMADYSGTSGGLLYAAGGGNETLDAGAGFTANTMFGGGDAAGGDLMIGGLGNDTMVAGAGADTMQSGPLADDLFVFLSANGGLAANDTVVYFNSLDTVWLAGYGAGAAATALSNATVANGSTTITLSDQTQITFESIGNVAALEGHVVST
jgi:hypothetical protein